jgi:hypothetical protein
MIESHMQQGSAARRLTERRSTRRESLRGHSPSTRARLAPTQDLRRSAGFESQAEDTRPSITPE